MVVIETDDGGAICVGQAAHAWISGQLARHWGNDRFHRPEPFEAVCLAAEQHDVGMAEWDLRPTLDPETGFPTSFMRMPRETHLALWTAAPRRALSQSPYSALLVSMHGHALYARLDSPEADVVRYVQSQEALQRELLERMGEDPQRARHNQRLLWTMDFLSLGLLLGWAPDSVAAPARYGGPLATIAIEPSGERRITVDPWPFDEDVITVRTSARRLEARAESEEQLHEALDAAPWVTVSYDLARRAGASPPAAPPAR